MVKPARLKLPFDFGGQTILSPKHHSGDQCFDGLVVGARLKWCFDFSLNPFFDSIASVPPSVQNRDEAGIPDRACPVDALPLQVAPIIKHAGVSINRRSMQLDHDLQTISRTQIQGIESFTLPGIVEKLRKSCPSAVGLRVYGMQFHVQISAQSTPLRRFPEPPDNAQGGICLNRNDGRSRCGTSGGRV